VVRKEKVKEDNMDIKGDLFLAENNFDEAAMLMGKVNALHGIYKHDRRAIDADLINAVFGFETVEDSALKAEKESSDYWYHRFKALEEELNKLKKEGENNASNI